MIGSLRFPFLFQQLYCRSFLYLKLLLDTFSRWKKYSNLHDKKQNGASLCFIFFVDEKWPVRLNWACSLSCRTHIFSTTIHSYGREGIYEVPKTEGSFLNSCSVSVRSSGHFSWLGSIHTSLKNFRICYFKYWKIYYFYIF